MYFPVLLEQGAASDESSLLPGHLWAIRLSVDTKREMVLFLWGQMQKLEEANIQDLRGHISGNLNTSFHRQMGSSVSTALLRTSRKAPEEQRPPRWREGWGIQGGGPQQAPLWAEWCALFLHPRLPLWADLQGSFHKALGLDGSGSELPGDLPTNTPDTCWEGPLTRTESLMHGPPGRPGGQNDRFHG